MTDDKGNNEADRDTDEETDRPARSEWVVAAIGGLLLLACVGYLVSVGLTRSGGTPDIAVTMEDIQDLQNGYLVIIVAENVGDAAAAEVVVEGELSFADGEAETSEATFDFVPERSKRRGGLFFMNDPAGGELTLRPLGYVEP